MCKLYLSRIKKYWPDAAIIIGSAGLGAFLSTLASKTPQTAGSLLYTIVVCAIIIGLGLAFKK